MANVRVEFSGQSFEASPNGFVWTKKGGERVEGPWSRIVAVMTFEATASVYGAQVGHWQHFGIALDDGSTFNTSSTKPAMFGVAAMTVQFAGPHIVKRMRQQLHDGQTLVFGPVSLSKDTLTFKKKSWPIDQLAGHKTFQGHWLFDTGSAEAPKLSGQVMLNRLTNFFALRVLLDELKPGLEYEDLVDKGSVWRPSASSHDPRYASGRTRLLVLGGPVAAALVVFLAMGVINSVRGAIYMAKLRSNEARSSGFVTAAEAARVDPKQPWTCDLKLKELSDVGFTTRTQIPGFPRPGFRDREDKVFGLSDTRETSTGREKWILLTRIKSVSPDADERKIDLSYVLIDTATGSTKCSGNQLLAFSGQVDQPYEKEDRLRDAVDSAMRRAVCDPDSAACLGREAVAVRLREAGEMPGAVASAAVAPVKPAPKVKAKAKKRR